MHILLTGGKWPMSLAVHGFLNPKGVALFGSMKERWFFGAGVVIKDLIELGFKGAICPVHPNAERVYGLKVSRDVCEIDTPIDLAVIITSYRQVPDILRKCGARGIGRAVVVSDGFGENGPEGRSRQEEMLAIAREAGIRIIGPNTLGVYHPHGGFTTIPYEKGYSLPPEGPLSIITQTGMYGPQAAPFMDYAFGIRSVIDLGNMCDIDETDCLEYLGDDPGTKVISLYMEHSRRPRELLEKARAISKRKPILCLKGGRSAEAADAMASHTGSLAGSDGLYDALFGQSGVIRVDEYEDLMDCAKVFSRGILPRGNRLGIITLTGAIGIQCIDLGAAAGLVPGALTTPSRHELAGISTTLGGHPIDLGPASAMDGPALFGHYMKCFDILMNDPEVDCLYVNLYIGSYMVPEFYEDVFRHMESNMRKPVVMWSYGPAMESVRGLNALGESHGIPAYATTGKAIRSLGHLVRYAGWRERVS
jgi:acetate---CoA ligase (ADP-forming)